MKADSVRLTGIVAMTAQRIIGNDGGLPWHLPEDLAFFKKTTSGHAIIMGRKTYDSIGRPLPKRRNIVMSRDDSWQREGVETVGGAQEAMDLLEDGVAFVIGGAAVYELFLPWMDELLITHVRGDFVGDTVFPAYEAEFPFVEVLLECEEFTICRHRRCE
jgi:dihydrofolate reductase